MFRLKVCSRCFIISVNNLSCVKNKRRYCQDLPDKYVKALVRCEVQLDPKVERVPTAGHSGRRDHRVLRLPERFIKTAHKILQDTSLDRKQLIKEAESFRHHLERRMIPATQDEVRTKAQTVLEKIIEEDDVDVDTLSDLGKEKLQESQMDRMRHKLKTMMYNWQPTEYNERNSMLYLLGRFSPDYAALHRIFDEIKKNVPDFKPKTFLDFGSGVGSGLWAVNECFPGSVSEAMCVDASGDMNSIAQLLLQDGVPNGDPWIQNVFFKRYLPPSNLIKYDLVVSAFSLMDMPTSKERLQVVNNLWNKTQDLLVIVEHGSYAGHTIVVEAREYILNTFNADPLKKSAHVLAPCQHDLPCPKLVTTEQRPCSSPARFFPLSFHKEKPPEMEKYSYVILSKKKHKEDAKWPRLISPVLKRPNHVVCRICNVNGKLYETIVTKFKCGKPMYQVARHCKWGDILPVTVTKEEPLDVSDQDLETNDKDESATETEENEEEKAILK